MAITSANPTANANVQVVARVRPKRPYEAVDPTILSVLSAKTIQVDLAGSSSSLMPPSAVLGFRPRQQTERFALDRVFGPESTNDDLAHQVLPIIDDVCRQQRQRATIVTYGQTGTGKTYTMLGPLAPTERPPISRKPQPKTELDGSTPKRGLMMRVMERLLEWSNEENVKMTFSCSYVEIYNNKLYDLLNTASSSKQKTMRHHHHHRVSLPPPTLEMRQDANHHVHVPGLQRLDIKCLGDFSQLIARGVQQRVQRATSMNEQSSRSHTILQIHVQFDQDDAISTISLVDLAGSEKLKKPPHLAAMMRNPLTASGAAALPTDHLKEFTLINQSLSHLGQCIQALLSGSYADDTVSGAYVPFRNCKLTRLLRESFLPSAHRTSQPAVLFILTLAPCLSAMSESLMTLDFANRIKQIRLSRLKSSRPSSATKRRPPPRLVRSQSMNGQLDTTSLLAYIDQLERRNEHLEQENERLESQLLLERQRALETQKRGHDPSCSAPDPHQQDCVLNVLERMQSMLWQQIDEIEHTRAGILEHRASKSPNSTHQQNTNAIPPFQIPSRTDPLHHDKKDASTRNSQQPNDDDDRPNQHDEDHEKAAENDPAQVDIADDTQQLSAELDDQEEDDDDDLWETHVDERTGFRFYHNRHRNISQWHRPTSSTATIQPYKPRQTTTITMH